MDDDEDNVTQELSDAHDTRDLVFGLLLKLAMRAIEHVEKYSAEGVHTVWLEERAPGGGFSWVLSAAYKSGDVYVRVEAEPALDGPRGPRMFTPEAFATAVGNERATVKCFLPREWIELAASVADTVPDR